MGERHKAREERQKFALPERKTIRNAVAKRPLWNSRTAWGRISIKTRCQGNQDTNPVSGEKEKPIAWKNVRMEGQTSYGLRGCIRYHFSRLALISLWSWVQIPPLPLCLRLIGGIIGLRGNYDDNCIERIVQLGGVGQGRQRDITKGAAHAGRRKT